MASARRTVRDVGTAGDCKRLCSEETGFACVSVNYQSRAASKVCELMSLRKADVTDKWEESTAADGFDYYEFHLVNGELFRCFLLLECQTRD